MTCRLYGVMLVMVGLVYGQTPTVPIPHSSETFYSYSPVSPPSLPLGVRSQLTFPGQATGSQNTLSGCDTYEHLDYLHYTYNTSTNTWSAPLTGPNVATSPTMFYESPPMTGWRGLSADMSMTGALQTNTDPVYQNFVQAVYVSTSNCYEFGPEFGFYRLLQNAGNSTEQNTIYFYYGLNVNCYNVGPLGSCRDRISGASLVYNVVTVPITLPMGSANSQGGMNFVFNAYVSSPTTWTVTIKDPYTQTDFIAPIHPSIDPSGFFASTASEMYTTGLTGYITHTQQRTSPAGGVTENMTNPLKLTLYSLAQVALLAVGADPAPAQITYARAFGNCMDSSIIRVAGTLSSSDTPVMRSYPRCIVAVYTAGTQTLASIYSTSTGTPLANPFRADFSGRWYFYGANGNYDVQLSDNGMLPYTLGDVPVFGLGGYQPNLLLGYPLNGGPGVMAVYNGGGSYYTGFTAGVITNNNIWTLPTSDSQGCLQSDGSFHLSFFNCIPPTPVTPTGQDQSVQYNRSGGFTGDSNFTWDYNNRSLTVSGIAATPSVKVTSGFVLGYGGFVSALNSWAGFNSNTDGANIRGLNVSPTVDGTMGGYINLGPLHYGNTPLPLSGLSAFGDHTALIWVAASNPATPDTTYGLNTNLYVSAAGGLATTNTPYNSVQSLNGGMAAKSFTALNYIQVGNSSGHPSPTQFDSLNAGAIYWDTGLQSLQVYDGSNWGTVGTGGGGGSGTPAGANTQVQFNNSGAFGGSTDFTFGSQLLTVNASGALNPGILVKTGFVQAENGFAAQNYATPATALSYNVVQAPTGGMAAKSFTATKYIQTGHSSGAPALTTNDAYHQGAMYWDDGANAEKVYNGSAWVSLGTGGGGGTTPGGSDTNVQFNSAGAFGGDGNFIYNSTNRQLTVTTVDSTTAGMSVIHGFVTADAGFLATTGTATRFNVIQAPGGGMAAKSFTAVSYVQTGTSSGTPALTTADAFHAGAMYFDTGTGCEKLYDGSSWSCLGGGGGGSTSPGGSNTNIQFNNVGVFGGSANLTWNNGSQAMLIVGIASTPGLTVQHGYIQSDGGIIVSGSSAYNSIQTTPTGGMWGRSFTALSYIQTGQNAGPPTPTTSDAFHPGTMFWDSNAGVEKVYDGSNWVPLSTTSVIGVGSLNGQSGALTLTGTANQVIVSTYGSNLVLTLPQSIATNSSVTFASMYISNGSQVINTLGQFVGSAVNVSGVVQCSATGSTVCFQSANSAFSVDGSGNISASGTANLIGGYKVNGNYVIDSGRNATVSNLTVTGTCTGCGANAILGITGSTNGVLVNGTVGVAQTGSITLTLPQGIGTSSQPNFAALFTGGNQTINTLGQFVGNAVNVPGAVQCGVAGTGICFQTASLNFAVNGNGAVSAAGGYNANGVQVIDVVGQFVGRGIYTPAYGITTAGVNPYVGGTQYNGQNFTLTINAGFSGIPGCAAALVFKGGVLVGCY